MSVCDLDPPIAGLKHRARILRGKARLALAACLAFTAIGQVSFIGEVNAAAIGPGETAMVAVAIPRSCDKDAESGGLSLAFRFGVPVVAAMESIAVAAPLPPPPMESTGSLATRLDVTPARQHRIIVAAGAAVVGIASTYNPTDPTDLDAGNEETASGEHYDPESWTAAIQTGLRDKFGGVRFGRNYRTAFALVEANDKKLIVKVNDVGPLKPGRIIDLNVRSMSYFDPTMRLGLISGVKVTPLAGQDWALGPVTDPQPVTVASSDINGSGAR